jgi:hypothetical protein
MHIDVNAHDVSGHSQAQELFGLVQNGLSETCFRAPLSVQEEHSVLKMDL